MAIDTFFVFNGNSHLEEWCVYTQQLRDSNSPNAQGQTFRLSIPSAFEGKSLTDRFHDLRGQNRVFPQAHVNVSPIWMPYMSRPSPPEILLLSNSLLTEHYTSAHTSNSQKLNYPAHVWIKNFFICNWSKWVVINSSWILAPSNINKYPCRNFTACKYIQT